MRLRCFPTRAGRTVHSSRSALENAQGRKNEAHETLLVYSDWRDDTAFHMVEKNQLKEVKRAFA